MSRGLLLAAFWLSSSAFAAPQDKTPFPVFTGEHVYVSGVPDAYESLRTELKKRENASPQEYYVVVVQSSGAGEWATRDYVDALYETWTAQAAQQKLKLDPERSVLIVLAVGNRRLSVHPGTFLQSTYGLRGPVIDREIVTPHFVPYARAEDYATGLTVLVLEIEKWIVNKEAALARARAEAEARALQLRNDAQTTLTAVATLSDEVQQELTEKEKLGLAATGLADRLEQAKQDLTAAREKLPDDPQAALDRGQAIQVRVQQVQSELRQFAARQTEAHARLDALDQDAAELEHGIERAARDGLATGALQSQVETLLATIDGARKSLASDPQQALDQAGPVENSLAEVRTRLNALPEQRQQLQALESSTRRLEEEVAASLERTRTSGADATAVAARIEKTRSTVKEAAEWGQSDYAQALTLFQNAARDFEAERTALQAIDAQHRFITRTIPIAAGMSILGVVTLSGAGLRLWHLYRRHAALKQLKLFKGQVVELSDSLDALKERHKQLPFTDPDFKSPMTGDTLALYQAAQDALGRYRQRWLVLMDAWDRAQAEIDAEAPFGTHRLQTARKILQAAGVPDEMSSIERDCAQPLDRLEQAHEEAVAIQAEIDRESTDLAEHQAKIQSANLSMLPYQADLESTRQSASHVRNIVVSDPIGTQAILKRSLDQLRATNRRLKGVIARSQEAAEALARLQAALELATAQRAAGFLLCEPEGNPDPLLAEGRELHERAVAALNKADADAAGRDLQRAFGLAERAVQAVKQQAQAKSFCETEIPARRAETVRLRDAAAQARSHYAELERRFSPESWRSVVDNPKRAAGFLAAFDVRVDEAAVASAGDVQHFVRSSGLLKEIQARQKETDLLLAAIGGRLKELVALREKAQLQLGEVRRRAVQVGELLRANTADRPRSNQRYQAAARDLDETARDATLARPDWEKLLGRLAEARSGLDAAEKLAREDIRLAEQAAAEIAEAEREIRRAKSFYKLGISANVAPAEAQLHQARERAQSQAYEQIVQLAAAARQAARMAYDHAVRQAEERQMALDQECQRQEALRRQAESAAVTAAAAHQVSQINTLSAPVFVASPPPPAPPVPNATSTTGWTSGSSQTGW